jgi:two-component system, sensor histidine kinase YesM
VVFEKTVSELKKLVRLFWDSSIRTKLICYFVLIILLTTMLIVSISGQIYRSEIINEQNSNTRQMVTQISDNVDYYIQEMERVIDTLGSDPRISAYLLQKRGGDSPELENAAYGAVLSLSTIHPEIAGIMIVSPADIYVSDVMDRASSEPLTDENWYTQAIKTPGKAQLFSKPIGRNITNIFQYSADDVVSISKAVINTRTGLCMGVILIDMKLDIIKHVIESFHPNDAGFIYIIDSKEEIVYSPVNTVVDRIRGEWLHTTQTGMIIKTIQGKQELLFHDNSIYTSWKTVSVLPMDEAQKVVTRITYVSYGIALLVMLFAIVLAVLSARLIANPITKLRLLMKSAQAGNFDVRFHRKNNDEIGQLGESYNTMIDKISELIDTVHTQEKSKRKAEIEILEAQINPHFLYNTLDTIQWMAQEHDAQDVVGLVESLTNMLRIGLSKGNEIITVRMEIKHVESYLMIQKTRYEDKLNYTIQVEEQLMSYRMIKLILQPLVENAIYHGIKEKRGEGRIQILGRLEDAKIHFQVIDNGIGMTPEKLEEINQMLKDDTSKSSELGYGVFNVNAKIKLNFGNEYGLRFQSTYGEGTIVDVWHPLLDNNIILQ